MDFLKSHFYGVISYRKNTCINTTARRSILGMREIASGNKTIRILKIPDWASCIDQREPPISSQRDCCESNNQRFCEHWLLSPQPHGVVDKKLIFVLRQSSWDKISGSQGEDLLSALIKRVIALSDKYSRCGTRQFIGCRRRFEEKPEGHTWKFHSTPLSTRKFNLNRSKISKFHHTFSFQSFVGVISVPVFHVNTELKRWVKQFQMPLLRSMDHQRVILGHQTKALQSLSERLNSAFKNFHIETLRLLGSSPHRNGSWESP